MSNRSELRPLFSYLTPSLPSDLSMRQQEETSREKERSRGSQGSCVPLARDIDCVGCFRDLEIGQSTWE